MASTLRARTLRRECLMIRRRQAGLYSITLGREGWSSVGQRGAGRCHQARLWKENGHSGARCRRVVGRLAGLSGRVVPTKHTPTQGVGVLFGQQMSNLEPPEHITTSRGRGRSLGHCPRALPSSSVSYCAPQHVVYPFCTPRRAPSPVLDISAQVPIARPHPDSHSRPT